MNKIIYLNLGPIEIIAVVIEMWFYSSSVVLSMRFLVVFSDVLKFIYEGFIIWSYWTY